jgi:hypothetical protein
VISSIPREELDKTKQQTTQSKQLLTKLHFLKELETINLIDPSKILCGSKTARATQCGCRRRKQLFIKPRHLSFEIGTAQLKVTPVQASILNT